MNKLMMLGRLTRDPQLKYLPSQTPVVEFGIAHNHRYRTQAGEDKERVTFVDCVAWGKTAELISRDYSKGQRILLEGRLGFDEWTDKQTGQKRSKNQFEIEHFHYTEDGPRFTPEGDQRPPSERRAQDRRQGPQDRPGGTGAQRRTPVPQPTPDPIGDGQEFKEDDIPF